MRLVGYDVSRCLNLIAGMIEFAHNVSSRFTGSGRGMRVLTHARSCVMH